MMSSPALSRLCCPTSRSYLRSRKASPIIFKAVTTSPPVPPSLVQRSIKYFFLQHPWLANCVIYGSLFTLAEFIQQTITRKLSPSPQDYDLASLGRYCVVGTGPQATMLHWWYVWLDGRYVGTTAAIVTKKVAADIFVISPPLYVSFFVGMSLLEGEEDVFAEFRDKLLPTLWVSCFYWTPAMAINFLLVPAAARVAFVGLCSLVWTNFMLVVKKMDWEGVEDENEEDGLDGDEENGHSQLRKAITKYVEQCQTSFTSVSK